MPIAARTDTVDAFKPRVRKRAELAINKWNEHIIIICIRIQRKIIPSIYCLFTNRSKFRREIGETRRTKNS